MIERRRAEEGFGFWWDLVHIGQGLIALSLLWDLLAITANHIIGAVAGTEPVPILFVNDIEVGGNLGRFCLLFFSEPVCATVLLCIFAGLLTYFVVKLVCWTEWVKEEITWQECWEEKDWYNPWDWVTTLVCVTKKAIQWVLKQFCKYIGYIVVVAIIVCIVVGVLAL